MKIYRIVLSILLILCCLLMMAASCEPDPTPTSNPIQKYPGWEAEATAKSAAEEFHIQLTARQKELDTPEP